MRDNSIIHKRTYFCDFETLTENNYFKKQGHTEILKYYIKDINKEIVNQGEKDKEFLDFLQHHPSSVFYFHNLSFDGDFIEKLFYRSNYIFVNEIEVNHESREKMKKTFSNIRINNNIFQIKMQMGKKRIHTFICSKKLLSASIEQLGKNFNLDKKNDYIKNFMITKKNPDGYQNFLNFATPESKVKHPKFWEQYEYYCERDVDILIDAFNTFKNNMEKNNFLTYTYTNKFSTVSEERVMKITNFLTIGQLVFKIMFKYITEEKLINYRDIKVLYKQEDFLRRQVRGGLTQFSYHYFNREVNEDIVVLDINSSYPFQMTKLLPYGDILDQAPKKGDYLEYVEVNVLYGKIKKEYDDLAFFKNVDKKSLFFRHYNKNTIILNETFFMLREELELLKEIYYIEIDKSTSYYFKAKKYLKKFIDDIYSLKENAPSDADAYTYKLSLNTSFGKLLQRTDKLTSFYTSDEELLEMIKLENIWLDEKEYLVDSSSISATGSVGNKINHIKLLRVLDPDKKRIINSLIGGTITAYGRIQLIESILKLPKKHFIYCDTDSIFFKKYENWEKDFNMDKKLGNWKVEGEWKKGVFIGSKKYFLTENINTDGKNKVATSGIRNSLSKETLKDLFYNYANKNITIENATLEKSYDDYGITLNYITKTFSKKEKY